MQSDLIVSRWTYIPHLQGFAQRCYLGRVCGHGDDGRGQEEGAGWGHPPDPVGCREGCTPVSHAWWGSTTPKLPRPSRTYYLCFSSLFITPNPPAFLAKIKKSQEHLAQHCRNGLYYDPLKTRINFECSSVSFISLPSVSLWSASPEMGNESGMKTLFPAAASELVLLSCRLSVVGGECSGQAYLAPR